MQKQRVALLLSLSVAAPFSAAMADPYTFTTITVPGIPGATVRAINDAGQIAGDYGSNSAGKGYVENLASGAVSIFTPPGGLFGYVTGINNLGQVSDIVFLSGFSDGYIYDSVSGTLTTLSLAGAPRGINDTGQIVGLNNPFPRGSVYGYVGDPATNTVIRVFGPGGTEVFPNGINNRGQVVGSVSDPTDGNFRNGIIVDVATGATTLLNVPGSSSTTPESINDKGQVVGLYQTSSSSNPSAFLFDTSTNQYTTLTVPGPDTTSTSAYGINNAGQIVGEYIDSRGIQRAFLATPSGIAAVPEPSSFALLGGGIGVLAWVRRRVSGGLTARA